MCGTFFDVAPTFVPTCTECCLFLFPAKFDISCSELSNFRARLPSHEHDPHLWDILWYFWGSYTSIELFILQFISQISAAFNCRRHESKFYLGFRGFRPINHSSAIIIVSYIISSTFAVIVSSHHQTVFKLILCGSQQNRNSPLVVPYKEFVLPWKWNCLTTTGTESDYWQLRTSRTRQQTICMLRLEL